MSRKAKTNTNYLYLCLLQGVKMRPYIAKISKRTYKITLFINFKTKQNEESIYFKLSLVMPHRPGDDDGLAECVG